MQSGLIEYRIYNESGDDDEEAEGFQDPAQQELSVSRWAIKWRSVLLACMGHAFFPYHRHLRSLDLRDLDYLFRDPKFRTRIER